MEEFDNLKMEFFYEVITLHLSTKSSKEPNTIVGIAQKIGKFI
jgi:hypothetical protein